MCGLRPLSTRACFLTMISVAEGTPTESELSHFTSLVYVTTTTMLALTLGTLVGSNLHTLRSQVVRHDVDTQTEIVRTTDFYVSRNGFQYHAYPRVRGARRARQDREEARGVQHLHLRGAAA